MASRNLLVAATLLSSLSCGDPAGPAGGVAILASRDAVAVKNTSDESALFAFIIDEDQAALIHWVPCVEVHCGIIRPGDTRRVTAEELGSGEGQVVLVYWWRGDYGIADQYGPGPVTMERVVLRNGPLP